jgi:2,3-diketo-5-methylthio-1-phosphopentane phosphatase
VSQGDVKSSFAVLVDFDGTAAEHDVQQVILDAFADRDEWRRINREWAAGRMSTAERARQQWALVRAGEREILTLLNTEQLDPDFASFADFCRRRGYPLCVVSDGFDFYIRPILTREGLEALPLSSNSLSFVDGKAHMTFLHQRSPYQYYGNDKTFVIDQLRSPGTRIAYVGDGFSDRAAAHHADLVFAKSRLATYCLEQAIAFVPFETFRDVQSYFEALEPDPA